MSRSPQEGIECCRGASSRTLPSALYVSVQKQSLNPEHQPSRKSTQHQDTMWVPCTPHLWSKSTFMLPYVVKAPELKRFQNLVQVGRGWQELGFEEPSADRRGAAPLELKH
jgi:hypothetical protein